MTRITTQNVADLEVRAAREEMRVVIRELALCAARLDAAKYNAGVLKNDLKEVIEPDDLFIASVAGDGVYEIQDGGGWVVRVVAGGATILPD